MLFLQINESCGKNHISEVGALCQMLMTMLHDKLVYLLFKIFIIMVKFYISVPGVFLSACDF